MTNPMLSSLGGNGYSYLRPRSIEPAQRTKAVQKTASPPQQGPQTKANDAAAEAKLTADEAQLIAKYFPESPTLKLRLYGPRGSTQASAPGTVGTRIDLRG